MTRIAQKEHNARGAMLDKEYPFIRAWGEFMGSMNYYIRAQQENALAAGAPHDATYMRDWASGWQRAIDITSSTTREYFKFHYSNLIEDHNLIAEWERIDRYIP